jgi:hypothetical protein
MGNDYPSYTDGKKGLRDPICQNISVLVGGLPLAYHWIKDTLKMQGRVIEHILEGEGDHLGSDTKSTGVKKGMINIQLVNATDAFPLPGHVIEVIKGANDEFYIVSETPEDMERNQVVREGFPVVQAIHPVFKGLQSAAEGDTLRLTKSIAAGGTTTLDPQPVNLRPGATLLYSALQSNGAALPDGVAISSSTGVITFTHASLVTGTYTILVDCLDTLVNKTDRQGEATLVLTVTA